MDICRTLRFSASISAIISAFGGLLATGCGGGDKFSEKHANIIEYDCEQTAPCDTVFSIREDAVMECVTDTSTKLDRGTAQMQAMYMARFSSCSQYSGCDYFNCASDTMLFSLVNQQKLQYDCTQRTACKMMSGMPTVPTETDTCFATLAKQLDFATQPDKATWDQRFARCGTLAGCVYVGCQ